MGGSARRPSEPGRPLSMRAIVLTGVVMGVVGAVAVAALLHFYGGGTARAPQPSQHRQRDGLALVAGTGGAMALLLAARRQRSTELTLEYQREVAVEQCITEFYTLAVDQLGSDQAPVRLGACIRERCAPRPAGCGCGPRRHR